MALGGKVGAGEDSLVLVPGKLATLGPCSLLRLPTRLPRLGPWRGTLGTSCWCDLLRGRSVFLSTVAVENSWISGNELVDSWLNEEKDLVRFTLGAVLGVDDVGKSA